MSHENGLFETFHINGKHFSKAGKVSTKIKEILKEIGIDSSIIRRVAIASYEAEMNVVMYAEEANVELYLNPSAIILTFKDRGQGIKDMELAMQEGFSTATNEMREMGFGAGMGLPNIKKNADRFDISSFPGRGTTLNVSFYLDTSQ